jgi:hypothetical protein
MGRRVFKGHPDELRETHRVTYEEIHEDELAIFIKAAAGLISKQSFGLFDRLSKLPPARRLSVNLKTLLDLMASKDVVEVLRDGLTQQERAALIELHTNEATPKMMEIAHALLCIDERDEFICSAGQTFKDLLTKHGGFLP